MKSSIFALAVVFVAGCSGGGVNGEPGPGETPADPIAGGTGEVAQPAQFVDNAVFNATGMMGVSPLELHLTTDINPADVQIFYVSDKTTDTGHITGTVSLITTLSLAANQTKTHVINWANSAFSGNYGCIFASSLQGVNGKFQAELLANFDSWSVGGSVFDGGSFRIPYFTGITRAVIAVTNTADFAFDVTFESVDGTEFKTINLPVLSTYNFDSTAEGWTLHPPGSIQVTTTAGGTIVLSGYLTKGTTSKYRFYPVKAAPYF